MTIGRIGVAALLLAAFEAGELSVAPAAVPPLRTIGGYHVLAADFHVHSHPGSWGSLSPWDTVIEARRQGLDAIAMTPHNHIWVAELGRWYSRITGGPIVIVSEEIAAAEYHLIAVGIHRTISPRLSAADAVAGIHAQGGVAIAAHPYRDSWPGWEAALDTLDGAEVVRPESLHDAEAADTLRRFFGRGSFTAIGSSDYHGLGAIGYARTFVIARERTERGIVDALRDGRTVVYDRGQAYGDPALIALASREHLDPGVPEIPEPGAMKLFSRLAALAALAAAVMVRLKPDATGSG